MQESEARNILGMSSGDNDPKPVFLEMVKAIRTGCEAGGYQREFEAYLTLKDGARHVEGPPAGWLDWLAVYAEEASDRSEEYRTLAAEALAEEGRDPSIFPEHVIMRAEVDFRRDHLGYAPSHINHDRLVGSLSCVDAVRLVEDMIGWPEFADHRDLCNDHLVGADREGVFLEVPQRLRNAALNFGIRWRCGSWKRNGSTTWGNCKLVSKSTAPTWDGAAWLPKWTITLNLGIWLLLSPEQRRRLIHHEMCHADTDHETGKPKTRGHAIEENPETLARFGAMGGTQAFALLVGNTHKETARLVEAAGWDQRGQGLLFMP